MSQYYKITEIELFIILTLYEIRNDRILSIGRYFPKFYFKIENFYKKLENLNIPKLYLKSYFDTKVIENYKSLLENQAKKYLEAISLFSSLKNYALIIQKDFAPDFDFYIV